MNTLLGRSASVLFLMPSDGFGGTELHTAVLARHLASEGHAVTVAFLGSVGSAPIASYLRETSVTFEDVPLSPPLESDAPATQRRQHALTAKYLQNSGKRPDLIVIPTPSPKTGLGVFSAATKATCPVVLLFHFPSINLRFSDAERLLFFRSLRQEDRLVCVSEYTRDKISEALGLRVERFDVIPNGVPPRASTTTSSSLARLMRRPRMRSILTIGRLHPQKGYDLLADAIPRIVENFPEAHFFWAGDGPDRMTLEARLIAKGVERHVSFLGHVANARILMQHADLIVLPTRAEGLSLALLEALSEGCAIVTTDASYQDRILTHELDGLIVQANDPSALATAVCRVLASDDFRASLAREALYTSHQYDESVMLQAYGDYFSTVIRTPVSLSVPFFDAPISQLEIGESIDSPHPSSTDSPQERTIEFISNGLSAGLDVLGSLDDLTLRAAISAELRNEALRGRCDSQFWIRAIVRASNGNETSLERELRIIFGGLATSIAHSRGALATILNGIEELTDLSENATLAIWTCLTDPLFVEACRGDAFRIEDASRRESFGSEGQRAFARSRFLRATGRPAWADLESWRSSHLDGVVPPPLQAQGRKKVLIVAPWLTYPARNGSGQRMLEIAAAYSKLGYRVGFFTWPLNPRAGFTPREVAALQAQYNADVHVVRLTADHQERLRQFNNRLKTGVVNLEATFIPEINAEFYNFLEWFEPDIVHVNYVQLAWLITGLNLGGIKKVVDTHDIISRRAKVFNHIMSLCGKIPERTSDVPETTFDSHQFDTLAFEFDSVERDLLRQFDSILAISQQEASELRGQHLDGRIHFLPHRFQYLPRTNAIQTASGVFLGSKNALNIIGANALDHHLQPRLSILIDDLCLSVAGDVSDAMLDTSGVQRLGFVSNLSELYANHSVALVPLPCSTGQNIKIAEAMSRGIPSITFSGVAAGSGVQHQINGLVANNLEEFFQLTREYMEDAYLRQRLATSTSDYARSHCDTERTVSDLERAIGTPALT